MRPGRGIAHPCVVKAVTEVVQPLATRRKQHRLEMPTPDISSAQHSKYCEDLGQWSRKTPLWRFSPRAELTRVTQAGPDPLTRRERKNVGRYETTALGRDFGNWPRRASLKQLL
jgi:hypothetical protein